MKTLINGLYFGKQVKDMITIQKGSESFQFKAPNEISGEEALVVVLVEDKNIKVDYRPDLLKSHIDMTGYRPVGHVHRMVQANHLAKSFGEDRVSKLFEDDLIIKSKSYPVGTVHNGYKKVAEGKWQKVSKHKMTKQEHIDFANEEYKRAGILRRSGSGASDTAEFNGDYHKKHAEKLDDKEYSDTDVIKSELKEREKLAEGAEKEKEGVEKSVTDLIQKGEESFSNDISHQLFLSDIEKGGKRATIGEVRTYNNEKWVKHADGWVHVNQSTGKVRLHGNNGKVIEGTDDHKSHYKTHHERHERETSIGKETDDYSEKEGGVNSDEHLEKQRGFHQGRVNNDKLPWEQRVEAKKRVDEITKEQNRRKDETQKHLDEHTEENYQGDGIHRHTSDNKSVRYSKPGESKEDFHKRIRDDVKLDNENQKKRDNENYGQHIGTTKSGKRVHADKHASGYEDFSKEDHAEAAKFHKDAASKEKDKNKSTQHKLRAIQHEAHVVQQI